MHNNKKNSLILFLTFTFYNQRGENVIKASMPNIILAAAIVVYVKIYLGKRSLYAHAANAGCVRAVNIKKCL